MFSNADLNKLIATMHAATTGSEAQSVFDRSLDAIPAKHPKREDFLWKPGQAVERLNDVAAERLAYASALRAADYAYDLINIGEAARALSHSVPRCSKAFFWPQCPAGGVLGAMAKATDDTFALRVLEFTQNRDRNKILTNFSKTPPRFEAEMANMSLPSATEPN